MDATISGTAFALKHAFAVALKPVVRATVTDSLIIGTVMTKGFSKSWMDSFGIGDFQPKNITKQIRETITFTDILEKIGSFSQTVIDTLTFTEDLVKGIVQEMQENIKYFVKRLHRVIIGGGEG
jgi:hypothetical protein